MDVLYAVIAVIVLITVTVLIYALKFPVDEELKNACSWGSVYMFLLLVLSIPGYLKTIKEKYGHIEVSHEYIICRNGFKKEITKRKTEDVKKVQHIHVSGKNGGNYPNAINYSYDFICLLFDEGKELPDHLEYLVFVQLSKGKNGLEAWQMDALRMNRNHPSQMRRRDGFVSVELEYDKTLVGNRIKVDAGDFLFFLYTDEAWQDMKDLFGDKVKDVK